MFRFRKKNKSRVKSVSLLAKTMKTLHNEREKLLFVIMMLKPSATVAKVINATINRQEN